MIKKLAKILIVIGVVLATLVFLILGIEGITPEPLRMSIGDAMEVLVLTVVSYLLVSRDNENSRKKDATLRLVFKLQEKLSQFAKIEIDADKQKKVTRIKFKIIQNYIEILKREIKECTEMTIIVNDIDNLSVIVLDNIEDKEHIEKSYAEIFKIISNIDMQLEQIAFKIS